MRSMQDRVNMIGGKLELASQPGEGTSVHIFVPNPGAPANYAAYP
jgi:signal transduction histidine kinase